MWGTGSPDEGTLAARFNALHPDLRVHNHGESGYVSRQNLARLQSLVNEGEAMDLVIFYDGYNDGSSPSSSPEPTSWPATNIDASTAVESFRSRS